MKMVEVTKVDNMIRKENGSTEMNLIEMIRIIRYGGIYNILI